ncbi:hypothetical protein FO519_006792 [Halicephalobus sp. NKZ332]|nr:hypothetical protein FO519_006792 [Halicephalobus sp. NKZ332]
MEVEVPAIESEVPEYKLAGVFKAHQSDVKQVFGTASNTLLSCSRDDTLKLWGSAIYNPHTTNQLASYLPVPTCAINSLAYVEYRNSFYIFGGRKDGSIVVYEGNGTSPFVVLKAHTMNVCCLHVNKEYSFVVSGGWDHNAIIWSLDSIVSGRDSDYLKLVGHTNSVWAINSFNDIPDSVLTGSADRTVKQWRGDQLVCTYSGHEDVVRSILCVGNGNFFSACNDSKIRCYNRDIQTPVHTIDSSTGEFIYSLHKFEFKIGDAKRSFLAASMETGVIEIFSIGLDYSLHPVTSLMIPNETAWSVTTMPNNDLVVGAADGNCYVFTWTKDRIAPQEIMDAFLVSMDSYIASHAKAREDNEFVTIKVALDDGPANLELKYQKGTDPSVAAENFIRGNNLPMSYLNEVTEYIKANIPEAARYETDMAVKSRLRADASGREKTVVNGEDFDYAFDVKLDDGRMAKLAYNVGEDPVFAAQRFVETYNLPISSVSKIANLLRVQIPKLAGFATSGNADPLTGGSSYTTASSSNNVNGGSFQDPLTGSGRYIPGATTEQMPIASLPLDRKRPRGILVPLAKYVVFGEPAVGKAVERLRHVNASQEPNLKLDDEQIQALEILMKEPSSNIAQIHVSALEKGLSWLGEALIPLLDALRIGILNEVIANKFCRSNGRQTFEKLVNVLISEPNVPLRVMALRCLANSASQKCSDSFLQSDITLLTDIVMNELQSDKAVLQSAAGAVLANLSLILWRNTEVLKIAELGPREDALRSIIRAFENGYKFDEITEQSLITILQAVATIMWGDASVIRLAKDRNLLKFVNMIKDKVADDVGKGLARDVVEMVHAV